MKCHLWYIGWVGRSTNTRLVLAASLDYRVYDCCCGNGTVTMMFATGQCTDSTAE